MPSAQNPEALAKAMEYRGSDFVEDEIPEKLQDDLLVAFFRERVGERAHLLEEYRTRPGRNATQQKRAVEQVNRLEKEVKRIEKLRKTFSGENPKLMEHFLYRQREWRKEAFRRGEHELASLDKRLKKMQSRGHDTEWRSRREELEQEILQGVSRWRLKWDTDLSINIDMPYELQKHHEGCAPPKKDSFLGRFQKRKHPHDISNQEGDKGSRGTPQSPSSSKEECRDIQQEDDYGITVNRITLSKEDPDERSYMSHSMKSFPLKTILYAKGEDNPLTAKCEEGKIRYFHFPANNMRWVEEAIARYYGEESNGDFNYRASPDYRPKSSNILCREFWSSRSHDTPHDPVHARHMRAHCSLIIPQNLPSPKPVVNSKNFVIFMPYLHWETHKRRKAMAAVVKEVTNKHFESRVRARKSATDEFHDLLEAIKLKHAGQLTKAFEETERKASGTGEVRSKKPSRRSPLAEYLLQIAKLHDAMDIEHDVKLVRNNLYADPPLHLRRTLDQSYYWKMSDTDGRDEDQVVYRATKEGKSVSRTSRVIMVDQLWLYVLDDNTIISFFPRRWGRNKPDYSGVHKGIRSILDHLRPGQIESVYDLALLIMNQCSTVFFDKTKPVDERPDLLDIFANALSCISGQKTVAFETFWRHLDRMSGTEQQMIGFEATARSYLNINPEGELLREAHDIIEELRMMSSIYSHQLSVMGLFSDHIQALFEKERTSTPDETLNVLKEIKLLLSEKDGESRRNSTDTLHAIQNFNEEKNEEGMMLSSGAANTNALSAAENKEPVPPPKIPDTTIAGIKRVHDHMSSRKTQLEDLENHTKLIAEQLKDLLSLKQQQASIIEAKYALKRADESVNRGRSIMLFTIVTIIFLPLSFMSSVFGMNASSFEDEQGNNRMTLHEQFLFLFPISFGVIVISVALAFSPWIRCIIYYSTTAVSALFIEYTGLRRLWLNLVKEHEYDETVGSKYRERNPDDIYAKQQKTLQWIYSRKERNYTRNALRKVNENSGADSSVDGSYRSSGSLV